jgi:hypothetical protein
MTLNVMTSVHKVFDQNNFDLFPNIFAYVSTDLRYIPVVIPKSDHLTVHCTVGVRTVTLFVKEYGFDISFSVFVWLQNIANTGNPKENFPCDLYEK